MPKEEDTGVIEIEVPMTKVVTVRLDYDLLQAIDRAWRALGYSNRSEFIRDALSHYLAYLAGGGSQKAAQVPNKVKAPLSRHGIGADLRERLKVLKPHVKR